MAQATTTLAGNVSSSVGLSGSSALTLGASMTLSSALTVPQYSTLDMAGYGLSAPNVTFGSGSGPANVLNRGPITTANLNVYAAGETFNLNPSDSVTNFNLYGGTSTLNSPVSTLTLSNGAGDDDRDGQREQQREPLHQQHADAGGLHDAQQLPRRGAGLDAEHGGLSALRAFGLPWMGI